VADAWVDGGIDGFSGLLCRRYVGTHVVGTDGGTPGPGQKCTTGRGKTSDPALPGRSRSWTAAALVGATRRGRGSRSRPHRVLFGTHLCHHDGTPLQTHHFTFAPDCARLPVWCSESRQCSVFLVCGEPGPSAWPRVSPALRTGAGRYAALLFGSIVASRLCREASYFPARMVGRTWHSTVFLPLFQG
jgi:hypothetical protein